MEDVEFDLNAPLSQLLVQKRKARRKESQAPSSRSPEVANNLEHASFLSTSKDGMDVPLSQASKQKRKSRKRESPAMADKRPGASNIPEYNSFPATTRSFNANTSPDILVSKFNYSVQSYFEDIDTISKLCQFPDSLNVNHPEIKRLSNSITFLREWSDFKYAPRVIKFACQSNSKEKEVMGGVTLPQFSAASVPKETHGGSVAGTESRDFVIHVGGVVWALDWCPRVDHNSDNHIKCEFIAVAAHPPESSYHKIGAPLTGRGAIQIWCFPTVHEKEDIPSQGSKRSKSNSQKMAMLNCNETPKVRRPRGRPRKKPVDDSLEKVDMNSLNVQPLSIEYPEGSKMFNSTHGTSARTCKQVYCEDSVSTQTEHANMLLLNAPEDGQNKVETDKDQVHKSGVHVPRPCELGESAVVNRIASTSIGLDSNSHDDNATCTDSVDANISSNSIPLDVALPRMMLCLAHNGRVAWDVKWRPVNACDPESKNIMGYLAVLLGNGALEVWEVPCPHTMKLLYPVGQKQTDPRFVKLQPVFRCSMLKFGNRQSIPLTMEWSVSSPNDMILAGCHDGVVALWKFSVSDSLTETRPLLSFSADVGPIRTLAWAPVQSDPDSANIIVTAGYKGFKFWDIRDPFRPLWDYSLQGVTLGLSWLPDPRCLFGSFDDGTMWLLSLARAALDIPITGKASIIPKPGFHIFLCSSFAIWSLQASQLTGPWRWFDESMLDCCEPLERVRDKGISFGKVVCLGHCAGANIKAFRTNQSTIDDFRKYVLACSSSNDCHVISSYHRGIFKQTGTCHFSPIGGYHAERDMALILDVARFKYPPHWVPLGLLWEAMDTVDESTGQHRGFMLVSRHQRAPAFLYSLSCNHESWITTAKYMMDNVPELLTSETLKDLQSVLSPVFKSLPSHFAKFIKWLEEIRRKEDNFIFFGSSPQAFTINYLLPFSYHSFRCLMHQQWRQDLNSRNKKHLLLSCRVV